MKAAFLIHGFITNSGDFARLVPLLKTRYDFVCCPDLPFHAKHEQKTQLSSKTIVDFVVKNFDELKEKYGKVDVFGFSMGGALAVHLAKIREVNRLVLLAPAIKYISASFLFVTAKYYLDNTPRVHRKVKKDNGEQCVSCFEDVKKDNADAAKMFFKQLLPRYTPKNLAEFAKIIRVCNKDLKEIKPPVLMIWGRLDQLVPPTSVSYLYKLSTHNIKRKIIYADLSHYMLYSRSFYRIIDNIFMFLEQSGAPRLTYSNWENKGFDPSRKE